MTRIADMRSILAVDPGSRGLAFAFFEGGALLDWGTRRDDGDELALLDRLVTRYQADVVVLENADAMRSERRGRIRRLLSLMTVHALKRAIVVVPVSRFRVRQAWAAQGKRTKHEVAVAIGAMFPEIEPLVPRKRKVYRSEEARSGIFDAVSLVVHVYSVAANDKLLSV